MVPVGLNGFGRIGKCIFLLMLQHEHFYIAAINAPDFNIYNIETYLKNDSVHKYNKDFVIDIVDDDNFKVNGHTVHVFRDRNPENLYWNEFNIEILIDATGAFLTQEKIRKHGTKYTIMTAPPKDATPMFVYGANHLAYSGEEVISNASCTTNCITPVLAHLEDKYGIVQSNFTTIHSSTASQKVVDTPNSKSRTCRSIFNNIIPHTTGASSSINKILPTLEGKITGTSVRVPVNNVSLVDLNVELKTDTSIDEIIADMEQCPFIKVCERNLVSSDYISTTCSSIVDKYACMPLGNNQFKIMIWYDNEWSYANQVIKLAEVVQHNSTKDRYFIEHVDMNKKDVVMRVDFNVPMNDGVVLSDYRVKSAIKTIKYVLESGASRIVLMSHMGRPKNRDKKYSLEPLVKILETYLEEQVEFLPEGLSDTTLDTLNLRSCRVYMLENLRFHKEETAWTGLPANNEAYNAIQHLGGVYVNDAFGSAHRDHLSINGIQCETQSYGYLIRKEIEALHLITRNPYKQKILAVIGGGKMDDKMELLKNLSKKVDTIYLCGGNINSLIKNNMSEYMNEISSNKAHIVLMEDGLAAGNLTEAPVHKETNSLDDDEWFYDIGMKSLNTLQGLIQTHSIIFWNGTLGVVEDKKYKHGSKLCMKMMQDSISQNKEKRVIVGGGDTGGFVDHFPHTFTHISTGGGASIEYITFDTLVGLQKFNL